MSEENIIYGVNRQFPVPQVNFGRWLHDSLSRRNRGDVIFEDSVTGEQCSVGELLETACELAKSIESFVQPGKVAAIASYNNPRYFTVVLAALYAGVPLALLDPNYTIHELRAILSILKCDVMFFSFDQCDKFKKVIATYRSIRLLVAVDCKKRRNFYSTLDDFVARSVGRQAEIKNVDVDVDVAFIFFTSGTTDSPRGVTQTHFSASATVTNIKEPLFKSKVESKVTLGVLPFFHVYGFYVALMSILDDRKVISMQKFQPEIYLTTIERNRIETLPIDPAIMQCLVKHPLVDHYDLSSVKEIGYGGAALNESSLEILRKKLNLKEVRQCYTLTEAGFGVCQSPYGGTRPGSVGKLYPGMSAVVKDVRTGKNLGPHAEGVICIKGDVIMKGYVANPKETKASFTSDGWLKTGDVGFYDRDGYFYIVDRLKDFIKCHGLQIAPSELEAILLTHPKIQDAGVIGKPDKTAGEVPIAFVVRRPNVKLTENEVKSYLGGFVKRSKQLQGGVVFVEEIPRTRSGMIKRKELRSMLTEVKSKL